MNHNLPKNRQKLLRKNFFEFSFDDREPNRAIFDSIIDPVEYHFIASIYNWDDGAEVLSWIVNSPICDRGTAHMIFWHAQPDFYTRFLSEEEATWAANVYKLLREIIHNVETGFYQSANFSYDPRKDPKAPSDIDYRDPKEKWPIPEYMKQPIKGEIEIRFE